MKRKQNNRSREDLQGRILKTITPLCLIGFAQIPDGEKIEVIADMPIARDQWVIVTGRDRFHRAWRVTPMK